MKINRSNYEMYVIDYLDGRLDAVEVSELLLFMEQNPALKRELELLNTYAPAKEKENEMFDKSTLKKPVYAEVKNRYQEKLVARLEGDLDFSEIKELEKAFVIYPELGVEAKLFEGTKVTADKSIVFSYKDQLKKSVPVVPLYFNYASRVAASLVVFWLILFYFRTPPQKTADLKTIATRQKYFRKEPGVKKLLSSNETRVASLKAGTKDPSGKKNESEKTPGNRTETNVVRNFAKIETIEQKGLQPVSMDKDILSQKPLVPVKVMNAIPSQSALASKQEDRYQELKQLAEDHIKKLTNGVLVERNKPVSGNHNFAFPNIGLLFVKLYNKTTGDNARVLKNYDIAGNVIGYSVIANNFEFSTGK